MKTENDCQLLLAVSGGVDSVVLCDLLFKMNFNFAIAHCNFQLRGADSERDEVFVNTLGHKYGKQVFVKRFDTAGFASKNRMGIEEAARDLRYAWFRALIKKSDQIQVVTNTEHLNDFRYLLTAHHANDNIETLLMNFFRGTGISGLHGILPIQGHIIRPLLFAFREEIQQYAKENNLQWVEDVSNESEKYTRNFFRLQLIPAIKKVFPNVEDNLVQNIDRFGEAEVLYQQAISIHIKKLVEQKGNELHIPVLKLQKAQPLHSIIWEIIKPFGFTSAQVTEVKKLLNAGNGSFVQSASHRIIKNRNWLIVAPNATETAFHIVIEKEDQEIFFEAGKLQIDQLKPDHIKLDGGANIAMLDAAQIQFPLLLRKWKTGDYFYPLGMQKKKKLSRFLIDLKLSKTEKEKLWVLEMNKKIIWVIGYRIDNRFKVIPSTRNVLKLRLS